MRQGLQIAVRNPASFLQKSTFANSTTFAAIRPQQSLAPDRKRVITITGGSVSVGYAARQATGQHRHAHNHSRR